MGLKEYRATGGNAAAKSSDLGITKNLMDF